MLGVEAPLIIKKNIHCKARSSIDSLVISLQCGHGLGRLSSALRAYLGTICREVN